MREVLQLVYSATPSSPCGGKAALIDFLSSLYPGNASPPVSSRLPNLASHALTFGLKAPGEAAVTCPLAVAHAWPYLLGHLPPDSGRGGVVVICEF